MNWSLLEKGSSDPKELLGLYRMLVENAASVMLVLDLEGNIRFINSFGLKLFGYGPQELLGRNVVGLLVPELESSGRDLKALMAEVLVDPDGFGAGENENLTRDGTRLWMRWNNKTLRDDNGEISGILSIGQDMTEQRTAEEALRASEERYRLLADNAADVIWTMDNEQNYTYVSPSVRRVLGYEPDELPAIPRKKRFPGRSYHIILESIASRAAIAKMHGTEPLVRQMRQVRKDGRVIWTEVVSTPICDDRGNCTGFVGVTRDISERVRLQEIKEEFDRIMQHDLKGPLSGIINLPSVLMDMAERTPEERELLEAIRYSGQKMLRLVNAFLDLHKIESGTYELRPRAVDLLREVESVRAEQFLDFSDKSLEFRVLLDGAPPAEGRRALVSADPVLLPFLISNLLKNAVEAAPRGSTVSVAIEAEEWTEIRIHNMGRVPREVEHNFFDKFATSNKIGGSGLGTYSAMLVARAHGGTIDMRTSETEGTTVTVRLPSSTPDL